MFDPNRDEETICAEATPPGLGGISVIRVSGREAVSSARILAPRLSSKLTPHSAHLVSIEGVDSEVIDQAVLTYFSEGRSYTGEETIEISLHGNPEIVEEVLGLLSAVGCRVALPGEFTYRAFMNGRIDLAQAEGVYDLVHGRGKRARAAAMRLLEGRLSQELMSIEEDLIWLLAQIEAGIDFSLEDISPADADSIRNRFKGLVDSVKRLLKSYGRGRVTRDGLKIVIYGSPNVGKSSLFNKIVGSDRSIVSETPGTTRDAIDVEILYQGQRLVFWDTAGLRDAHDRVEKEGIHRTLRTLKEADIGVEMVQGGPEIIRELKPASEGSLETFLVVNKVDLFSDDERKLWLRGVEGLVGPGKIYSKVFFTSALSGEGVEDLLAELGSRGLSMGEGSSVMRARHYEGLLEIEKGLLETQRLLENEVGLEYVSVPLQEAVRHCAGLLGKVFDDQVLDRVFRDFCIGK